MTDTAPDPTGDPQQPDPASAPPADDTSTNTPRRGSRRGRKAGEVDETGATPPANVRTQRYTDGQKGYAAGNLAAATIYEVMDEDGTYSGKMSKSEPERGRVVVQEGDLVQPHAARALADAKIAR